MLDLRKIFDIDVLSNTNLIFKYLNVFFQMLLMLKSRRSYCEYRYMMFISDKSGSNILKYYNIRKNNIILLMFKKIKNYDVACMIANYCMYDFESYFYDDYKAKMFENLTVVDNQEICHSELNNQTFVCNRFSDYFQPKCVCNTKKYYYESKNKGNKVTDYYFPVR